jgi:hypothetical protein
MACENIEIYFSLTKKQRREVNKITSHVLIELLTLEQFGKITKNKELRERFRRYKFRHGLKLAS